MQCMYNMEDSKGKMLSFQQFQEKIFPVSKSVLAPLGHMLLFCCFEDNDFMIYWRCTILLSTGNSRDEMFGL